MARSPKNEISKHAAREILRRQRAQASLLDFTRYTHPCWTTGDHHRLMCRVFERVERGELSRVMIFAPPRCSKSELASRRFPAWYLGKHPDRQIITASYGDNLARDMGADVRDIVRDPAYGKIFDTRLHADSTAAGRWRTTEGGIYVATGVGGPIVGRGFHVGIIDDPIKGRAEADSEVTKEKIWKWYWGNFYTRRMPHHSAILLMMTRWSEDDLAGRLLDTEGRMDEGGVWMVVDLPAIRHEHTDHEETLWPGAFPLEEMQATRAKLIKAGRAREWDAQYQQGPTTEQGTYIKREWFADRCDLSTLPKGLRIYMASDFAVTEEEEGKDPDYTEHGVFGVAPDKKLYVLDWWYGRTHSDEWVDHLLRLAAKWKPFCWFGEKGQIEKSIGPWLQREKKSKGVRFREEPIASTTDKAARGRSFQAMASARDVVFPRSEWAERVIDKCVKFPGGTHDDSFDVMSLMCLAIDEARPGIVPSETGEKKPRDRYKPIREASSKPWMTV